MSESYAHKSTVDEIRRRFDADVERFSNLETGQTATVDAPLSLELITQAAAAALPGARSVLDIGCGAGNYPLKLLQVLPDLDVTLIDLSEAMLARAVERLTPATSGRVETLQGDVRELDLGAERFDLILASQVFHHLRAEDEWRMVFGKCFAALKPGGALFINDLIDHADGRVGALMRRRWGVYLAGLKNEAYRDQVFAYNDREDTPRPLFFQMNILRDVGFRMVDILHKNSCFAVFYAVK
jgi:tRNA (cmo5U34)-methyltransferase